VAGNYLAYQSATCGSRSWHETSKLRSSTPMLSASLSGALGSLRERSQFFFSLLPPGEGRFAFDARREFLEENGDEFLAFNQALTRLAENWRTCRRNLKKYSTSRTGLRKFKCNSASRWNPTIATPSSGSSAGEAGKSGAEGNGVSRPATSNPAKGAFAVQGHRSWPNQCLSSSHAD